MTYEEQTLKERLFEEKKTSLRTLSGILDYGTKITSDFSFQANIFGKEQTEQNGQLARDESSAQLLTRLAELQEAAAALSSEFNALSMVKLKEADSITLANFEK